MDTSLTTSTLQPNGGGLQDGQTNLQPQSQSGNTQSTGALQQDALGPNAYRSFDGLTVQGAPFRSDAQSTTGKGTPEIFWGIFVLVTIAAVIVFALYKRKTLANQPITQDVSALPEPDSVVSREEAGSPQPTANKKKQPTKTAKKTASKKVVKKKTTAAKRKKKK